jgi:hypothetical protein
MVKQPQTATYKGFYSKASKAGLEILADEIQLALHWQRPSILLAIQKSKQDMLKNQLALEQELIKTNKIVKRLKFDKQDPDVINLMCRTPDHNEVIFFVSGMGYTNNIDNIKIYNALNLHRELLVEQNIRVVFWLTEQEAANLPYHAPDFWAFRHRVIEFAPTRGTKKKPPSKPV